MPSTAFAPVSSSRPRGCWPPWTRCSATLVTLDLPDALTGGLRRTLDALRAVTERTRGDVTTAVLQERLRAAMEGRLT